MPTRAVPLRPDEVLFVERLKMAGVLLRISDETLQRRHSALTVCCADGRHLRQLMAYHAEACLVGDVPDGEQCFHVLTRHGGSLALSPDFVQRRQRPWLDRGLIDEILEAKQLMGTSDLDLYMHWPCGAGMAADYDLPSALLANMQAVDRVRGELPGFGVTPFLLVYLKGEGRRTYIISAENWAVWSHEHPNSYLRSSSAAMSG